MIGRMRRTWWRQNSDGKFFRNCPAVEMDRERIENKLPWRYRALTDEWWAIFREGVTRVDIIPDGDRWLAYDDSPEATDEWCRRFLVSRGREA